MSAAVSKKRPGSKASYHPRNIYRSHQNFKQMAIDYPEFREIVKQVV